MNDPISNWIEAIKKRVGEVTIILVLLVFCLALVAPLLGPLFLRLKRRQYMMESNYEELAQKDMKSINRGLWIIAIVAWIVLIASQFINITV